jgi:hypothetical protein
MGLCNFSTVIVCGAPSIPPCLHCFNTETLFSIYSIVLGSESLDDAGVIGNSRCVVVVPREKPLTTFDQIVAMTLISIDWRVHLFRPSADWRRSLVGEDISQSWLAGQSVLTKRIELAQPAGQSHVWRTTLQQYVAQPQPTLSARALETWMSLE